MILFALARKHVRVLPALALVIAACLSVRTASASAVVVGTCKNLVTFSTIQAAINAVPSGSTVNVCPGTYAEQVTITKKLILTGVQAGTGDASVIVPPSGGLVQNGSDISVIQ
jgi:pectin methylesterase-like acyl-CoA thioesterase